MPPLTTLLPPDVLHELGDQFRRGVEDAAKDFVEDRGDEDTITGTLGKALRTACHGNFGEFSWRTRSWKLRGRGTGAPEKEYGADAVIEVDVYDREQKPIGRKSLPFQAKTEWTGADQDLREQVRKMGSVPGGGVVVDYSDHGYSATMAATVLAAGGNRRHVEREQLRDFGDLLAEDFLGCRVGSMDTWYDNDGEVLMWQAADHLVATPFRVKYRMRTQP